ncbi:hypothetical protein B6N60_00600 [Richelia sinica FACHB-800]|uniref:Uncharacterized protein n=1 Tax=Richelia sinica FACHB-800 TaxID=1357546 RepID=A0A975T4D2_9NOST|nr:hypothetical protein B6N60_00600 [Richelia sinica FACHB-800]
MTCGILGSKFEILIKFTSLLSVDILPTPTDNQLGIVLNSA